jgi:hypothetical protein
MKPTQSRAPSRASTLAAPQAIVSPASPALQPVTWLSITTITDPMIRELLADARKDCDTELAILCSKALRPLAAIKTAADARRCTAARQNCAREINDRADRWMRRGDARDVPYARHVGALLDNQDTSTGDPDVSLPQSHKPNDPHGPNPPLCWSCGRDFLDGDYRVVKTRSGPVSVHAVCVAPLVADGFVEHNEMEDTRDLDEDDR